jgi:uncharacterized protein
MKILLAGASGFLGSRLVPHLRHQGHETVQLVRREPTGPDQLRWNPATGSLNPAALDDVDAVVNLAGANVGAKRWTSQYKKVLVDSRVSTTSTLASAIARAERRPAVFLNSSAVGYYGDRGDERLDEQSSSGDGFLAGVCRQWEAATQPAADAGVRVVRFRTGIVLDPSEGILKPMLLQYRLFAGGHMGSGRQYVPWISVPDWLNGFTHLLTHDISGPANLCGPHPVTNAEFSAALAKRLHRPNLLPVPAFALKLVAGEFGGEAVASQRVYPVVLTGSGFTFTHETVSDALNALPL